jgi:capsular exopolysaccharide synthesis family protein
MAEYYNYEEEEKEVKIDILALFFKYLSYWKWFVASLIVCMLAAFLYLKTTTPVYQINSVVLLKDDKKGGGLAEMTNLKTMGLFNTKNNVDNELEVLKTANLTEQVVRELGLYVSYTENGMFRDKELYGKDCPVKIVVPEEILNSLTKSVAFKLTIHHKNGYTFNGIYEEKEFNIKARLTDSIVNLPFARIILKQTGFRSADNVDLNIIINNPLKKAESLLGSLSLELTSKTTSVVKVSFQTTSIERGKDFISKLIEMYNLEDMRDQNLVATNTAIFVDNRLLSLTSELNQVESEVENYKQAQGLTDIKSEADLFIAQTGNLETKQLEIETQLAIISDIDNYIHQKVNRNQLLPASLGIKSDNLNTMIAEYNNLLLEKKRMSRTASETNQVMIDLTDRIESMLSTVQAGVRNEKINLQKAQQDLRRKENQNAGRIKDIPRQEREYTEIKRQQGIKEALFLFLLQKKEENYLNMSVVVPKAKIIDKPRGSSAPISPKQTIIFAIAFLLGLILPIVFLYIRNLLRYKIENKEELESISDVAILGEIPKSSIEGNIIIRENSTNSFTEMFRLLRSNLLFVLNDKDKKVINVVSSIGGEGKTFICINLGMSLAMLDKKVLIIGLDVRKPKLGAYLQIDNTTGVTLYLTGSMSKKELIRPSGVHPNLSVITAGPVPPNPSEMMALPLLDELIADCREKFDYVILDTAPMGIVSDSFALNRFADVSLYVVRADYTPKKDIEEATKLNKKNRVKNMYFVLNAFDSRRAAYRYGYATRYGYGNKYGYGYRYGYGEDDK